ncbi:MAG: hypothetical protein K2L54_05975, partial [Clostridiales bacterium]|nr:hypothetical protein [Clostridiales bacterium]
AMEKIKEEQKRRTHERKNSGQSLQVLSEPKRADKQPVALTEAESAAADDTINTEKGASADDIRSGQYQ